MGRRISCCGSRRRGRSRGRRESFIGRKDIATDRTITLNEDAELGGSEGRHFGGLLLFRHNSQTLLWFFVGGVVVIVIVIIVVIVLVIR